MTAPAGFAGRQAVEGVGRAGGLPTRQRRPGLVAVGVALVLALSAVGAWLYSQAGQKTPVVVMVADVPAGHVIDRADVSTVDVAGAITAVAGSNLESVVGQSAAVHLLSGTLLQRSMLTSAHPLADGLAAVGVALGGGHLPADGVGPGDWVAVLQVPTDTTGALEESVAGRGGEGQARVLVPRAQVFSARPDPAQAGGTLVTVLVPVEDYVAVAAASGAQQVSLVEVAPQ